MVSSQELVNVGGTGTGILLKREKRNGVAEVFVHIFKVQEGE